MRRTSGNNAICFKSFEKTLGLDSCRGIILGNAVTVNVAEWIGKRLNDILL
jgi:site-specific DNA-cytosine methylase